MVFVTLGAGGGTGSGAGPIVAEESRGRDILTVGVVTKPFTFEGAVRRDNAEKAIEQLSRHVDALITIPNDRLLQTVDPRTSLTDTFKIADDVLRQGVQGISELITEHALINLDFADVKAVMKNAGSALMGIGRASGEGRATLAAQQAIESPLIEVKIDGARGVLFSVAGGYDMTMSEIQEAAEVITNAVSPDANIIFGASVRSDLDDEIVVTVVATGFDGGYYPSSVEQTTTVGDLAGSTVLNNTYTRHEIEREPLQPEREPLRDAMREPEQPREMERQRPMPNGASTAEFTGANQNNMWDSISSDDQGDDLDMPPSLRNRLRKNRE